MTLRLLSMASILGMLVAAFAWLFAPNPVPTISAIIVPHHNLVAHQRTALFAEAKALRKAADTIILLSPNHYQLGHAPIQTTDQVWQVSAERTIDPQKIVINQLLADNAATYEPLSFANEHGIKNILGDLATTYPGAKLVPLMLNEQLSIEQLEELISSLSAHCARCLVVSSVDFSHDQTADIADFHDLVTERALRTLAVEDLLTKAEVDSPSVLAVTALWAQRNETPYLHLARRTNGTRLTDTLELPTTTHFFGWYGQTPTQPTTKTETLLVLPPLTETSQSYTPLGRRFVWGADRVVLPTSNFVALERYFAKDMLPHVTSLTGFDPGEPWYRRVQLASRSVELHLIPTPPDTTIANPECPPNDLAIIWTHTPLKELHITSSNSCVHINGPLLSDELGAYALAVTLSGDQLTVQPIMLEAHDNGYRARSL